MNKIVYYSGHGEIIGGDAKYLFNIINNLDENLYTIALYTDRNPLFQRRAQQWLKHPIVICYLETKPTVFKKGWLEGILDKIIAKRNRCSQILRIEVAGYSTRKWILFLADSITFSGLRNFVQNVFVFRQMFIDERHVDIFHFNNGGYPGKRAGFCALLVARSFRVSRIIMTVHNEPAARSGLIDRIFDGITSLTVHKCICPSVAVANAMCKLRGLNRDKVEVVYCGLPDENIMSNEDIVALRSYLNLGDTVVLSLCGTLDEDRKGHAILFKALAILRPRFSNFKLLVIGDATQDPRRLGILQTMAADLGLSEKVIFLGFRSDTHALASISDIIVVPSLEGEATPYTIKEGERAGKPVITTYAGGCAEAVVDGITGYITEPGNIEELGHAIYRLCIDPELREIMGCEGRRLFLDKFIITKETAAHKNIYAL